MRASTWLVAVTAAAAMLSLPALSATTETNSQQEKMKVCNKEASAKSLTGENRQAFMKTCLSGTAKPN